MTTSDFADGVVYVSLAPGTVARGSQITIVNFETGFTRTEPLLDGGLDPVPVPAEVGHALELTVTESGGVVARALIRVEGRRPPRVVRTNPPRGKRDVPLNATLLVVFSEPMGAATLSAAVRLHRWEQQPGEERPTLSDPIEGTLNVSSDGLSAEFVPNSMLAASAEYVLISGVEAEDLSGERLEAPASLEFVTTSTAVPTSRIAFNAGDGIYIMNPDGSGRARVTESLYESGDWGASWSPDGSSIVFVRSEADGYYYFTIVNVDGSGLRRVISGSDWPAWSPDGTRIAFSGVPTQGPEGFSAGGIYLVNVDGSGLTRITHDSTASYYRPTWSPDGSRIAFASDLDRDPVHYYNYDIYAINVDGSGLTRLTNDPGVDYWPAWSPDGGEIAFVSNRDKDPLYGPAELYVMKADGSQVVRLTYDDFHDELPAWAPDGSRMVFASERPARGIYVINRDGSGFTWLGAGGGPAWSR